MVNMASFVGREKFLGQLDQALAGTRAGAGSFVWMRGRRRIGKSRLVEEFLDRQEVPHVFFQAPRGLHRDGLADFIDAAKASSLRAAEQFADLRPETWRGALQLAARGATPEAPAVIVIDEFPYLCEADDGIEADFQHAWDRELESTPVLLICIGSDLSMMERLLEPRRPLHGRPTLQMVLPGLTPAEVGELADLVPADAIDAYLIVGGFPVLARQWSKGLGRKAFLSRQLVDSSQLLVINGERIVDSEFPHESLARPVLQAIGAGQRTYTGILEDTGLAKTSMDRALSELQAKGVVERISPVSVPPRKESHYIVSDPHLRFWLRFIGPYIPELDRGRPDLVLARIERDWQTFRGSSVEPVVRAELSRLMADGRFGQAADVGSYWTRTGGVEIDLVGVDAVDRPRRIAFVGSIKWRENSPFDRRDAAHLAVQRAKLPGVSDDTLLLAVSRSGFSGSLVDFQLTPDDLLPHSDNA